MLYVRSVCTAKCRFTGASVKKNSTSSRNVRKSLRLSFVAVRRKRLKHLTKRNA